jgi:hypothetical protein
MTRPRSIRRILYLAVALPATSFAHRAQDLRNVVEPAFPQVCTQLTAQLTAGADGLPAAAETLLDTGRIQVALNSSAWRSFCAKHDGGNRSPSVGVNLHSWTTSFFKTETFDGSGNCTLRAWVRTQRFALRGAAYRKL